MPVSAAERRFILDQTVNLAQADVAKLWSAAERQSDVEFARYVIEAFPQIVDPYHQLSAMTSATFFENDFPDMKGPVVPAAPLPTEQLAKSAEWALGADGRKALDRMYGTVHRAIYDGDRNTTVVNSQPRGMRWVRVARPDACVFCRMLASRTAMGDTYRASEGVVQNDDGSYKLVVTGRSTDLSIGDRRKVAGGFWTKEQALQYRDEVAKVYARNGKYGKKGEARTKRLRGKPDAKIIRTYGDDYHDACRCTAKAIPLGTEPMDYLSATEPEFADLAAQWNTEYEKARDGAESGDPKKILSEWRQITGAS